MSVIRVSRRTVLATTAFAAATMSMPFIRQSRAAAGTVVPKGKMTLAWHTNIASRWLDPQQHDGTASPDNFLFALHDGLIKNFREQKYDHLALADKFDFPEDAESATFRLRQGIKFHDGSPITPDDVKWSYENYRGSSAKLLHEKTKDVKLVDDRTIRFEFTGPFFDFPILLGTGNLCGAGWVVPRKYYQSVGNDGFLQKPIGAGPYKLVSQEPGTKLVFEAFDDYYRPVHIKRLEMIGVPEAVTRLAMVERQEADIMYLVPGELIPRTKRDRNVMLAPVLSGSWWLEFPGFLSDPNNPFRDRRVREAVSLAIDRKAINDAESGGMGKVSGNWINNDVEDALDWPDFEFNVAKAKALMQEAGYPDGFKVDWLTVVPNYFSRGERVISQLKAIGINTRLQTMERGVYLKKLESGLKEWPGLQIIMNATRIGGSWANWYEGMFKCGGFQGQDMICVKELDAKFDQYQKSINRDERHKLAEEIQRAILENLYFVPVFRHAFVNAIGPRIKAEKWQDVFPTITTGYAYPWEDIELKETAAAQK
ncbi:MAG: ABC transporter substrate-binding protein [Alphaproteobacteria bacterium]